MGSRALTDEEKSKYEKELTDFITQKVKNHGGSLQFQTLIHLSNQLSFETKSAVAAGKGQLMKFLKSHPKLFKIDSKGIITIAENCRVTHENENKDLDAARQKECPLPQRIENGSGMICKMHAEFGFINATEPFETKVYFRASAFGDEYSLLTELCIQPDAEVLFNAVKGHKESEAQYRAEKVWLKVGAVKEKNKFLMEKEIHGEGVVERLGPDEGLVLFGEDKGGKMIFRKDIVPNSSNINSLDDIFSKGDRVLFTAIKKHGKSKFWEAISIRKLERDKNSDACDESEAIQKRPQNKKPRGGNEEKMTNVPGKISLHKTGTNILFGDKFMLRANGDSAVYFLYGCEVTEISWEFSDDDDVFFDAIKIDEEPGWKALLVWVGEKPDYITNRRLGEFVELSDEEDDADDDQESVTSSQNVRRNSDHSVQSNNQEAGSNRRYKGKNHRSRSRSSLNRTRSKEHCDQDSNDFPSQKFKEYSSGDRKVSDRSTRSKNKANSRSHQRALPEDESYGSPLRNSSAKSHLSPRYEKPGKHGSKHPLLKYSNAYEDTNSINDKYWNASEDTDSIDDKYSNAYEDTESIDERKNPVSKFLVPFDEDQNPVEDHADEGIVPGFASIKVHEGLSCEITRVYCKFAHAKNPCLEDQLTIVTNAFYVEGQSADEQQIDDLREVLSAGNAINLNCFVIVDDEGRTHHKVTKAWLGEEPQISEMTPEDFISENGLSVTISNDPEVQDSFKQAETSKRFLQSAEMSEDSDEFFDAKASKSTYSVSKETLNDERGLMPKFSELLPTNEFSHEPFDLKVFSDLLVEKLREQNLTFSEADPDSLSTEIVNYICSRNDKISSSVNGQGVENPRRIIRNSNPASKAVQTLVTGNIVAQSIFTEL